jgi:hypothetical protein
MTLNNVTLKLDADFTLKFGSMTDVYLKHLWGICLSFQFDNMLRITLCVCTSLTKENIRELSFQDSSIPLQMYFGDRITESNNFNQPRYLAQLPTGSNSLTFIFSECSTSLN